MTISGLKDRYYCGKNEKNDVYQDFLLFPQCFPKLSCFALFHTKFPIFPLRRDLFRSQHCPLFRKAACSLERILFRVLVKRTLGKHG